MNMLSPTALQDASHHTDQPTETVSPADAEPASRTARLGPIAEAALRGVRPREALCDTFEGGADRGTDTPSPEPPSSETPSHQSDGYVAADRTVPPLGGEGRGLAALVLGSLVVVGALAWVGTRGPTAPEADVSEAVAFQETPDSPYSLPDVRSAPSSPSPEPVYAAPPGATYGGWAEFAIGARPDPDALDARLQARDATASSTRRPARAQLRDTRRRAAALVFDASARVPSASGTPIPASAVTAGASTGQTLATPADAALARPLHADAAGTTMALPSSSAPAGGAMALPATWDASSHDAYGPTSSAYGNTVPASSARAALQDAGAARLRSADTGAARADAVALPDGDFLVTQGTVISAVLETAIQSDLPGLLRAQTTRDVWSRSGRTRVIPAGTRLIGRYASGLRTGQRRVRVEWTRLERPDGVVVALASPGTDAMGRAGVGGTVDRHLGERFGAGVLFSVIGAGVALLGSEGDSRAERELYRDNGDSFERTAEIALRDSLDIPPTLHVDQGTRITVFVNRDLDFGTALGGR